MQVKEIDGSLKLAFIMDRDDMVSLMEILNYLPTSVSRDLGTEVKHADKVGIIYSPLYNYFEHE